MATVEDLGSKFKSLHNGAYDDLTDEQVGELVKKKWPGSYDDFESKIPEHPAVQNPLTRPGQEPQLPPSRGIGFMNPRTGKQYAPDSGNVPLLDAPVNGLGQTANAASQLTSNNIAGPVHGMLQGLIHAASPLAAGAAVAAPVQAGLAGLAGLGGDAAAKFLASIVGASPNASDVAGDLGGLATGGLAIKKLPTQEPAFLQALRDPKLLGEAASEAFPKASKGVGKILERIKQISESRKPVKSPLETKTLDSKALLEYIRSQQKDQ